MTIAVGFLCDSGQCLVIASDQQFTSPGYYKYHEKKYVTKQKGYFQITCVFSGDPGLFAEVQQKAFGFLDYAEDPTAELVLDTFTGVIDSLNLRESGSLYLLIGVTETFAPPRLIVFTGKGIFVADNRIHVVGGGESSVVHYLANCLYSPAMTGEQGIALGAYLIKKATRYVDYCGEPIDVLCGDSLGFEIVPQDKIQAGIQKIESRENLLFTLLVQTPFQS